MKEGGGEKKEKGREREEEGGSTLCEKR